MLARMERGPEAAMQSNELLGRVHIPLGDHFLEAHPTNESIGATPFAIRVQHHVSPYPRGPLIAPDWSTEQDKRQAKLQHVLDELKGRYSRFRPRTPPT